MNILNLLNKKGNNMKEYNLSALKGTKDIIDMFENDFDRVVYYLVMNELEEGLKISFFSTIQFLGGDTKDEKSKFSTQKGKEVNKLIRKTIIENRELFKDSIFEYLMNLDSRSKELLKDKINDYIRKNPLMTY